MSNSKEISDQKKVNVYAKMAYIRVLTLYIFTYQHLLFVGQCFEKFLLDSSLTVKKLNLNPLKIIKKHSKGNFGDKVFIGLSQKVIS